MRKSILTAVAITLLAIGCEQEKPAEELSGGNPVGTWGLLKGSSGVDDSDTSHDFFDRITFYKNYSCYGELSRKGGRRGYKGDWRVTGSTLIVDCVGREAFGRYGADRERLVFVPAHKAAGANGREAYVMERVDAPESRRQPVDDDSDEADEDADDNGGGGESGTGEDGNTTNDGEHGAAGGSEAAQDPAGVALDGMPDEPAVKGVDAFLWKPDSESDGNAVCLFPAKYRVDRITNVFISGGKRDGETPRRVYWPDGHNGNRVHARWGDKGSAYGVDFDVVLVLVTGRQIKWRVNDGGDRKEM